MATFSLLIFFIGCFEINVNQAAKTDFEVDIHDRIWNGSQVDNIKDAPYFGFLYLDTFSGGGAICGGSLISNRHFLTAAHCCKGYKGIRVNLGRSDTDSSGGWNVYTYPTDWIYHENYNSTTQLNDICVIRLPKNVTFTDDIKPAKLVKENMLNKNQFANMTGYLYGLGNVNETKSYTPTKVQATTNRVETYEECYINLHNGTDYYIDRTLVCTEKLTSGACTGDSGGPLVVKSGGTDLLIGVISHGWSCEGARDMYYAFVPAYINWLKKNTDLKF